MTLTVPYVEINNGVSITVPAKRKLIVIVTEIRKGNCFELTCKMLRLCSCKWNVVACNTEKNSL